MKPYGQKLCLFFVAVLSCYALNAVPALAVNTINFSPTAPGIDKSVPVWGVDTAWPNFDNVRQSIHHIGPSNVEIARVLVYFDEPLVNLGGGNFELNASAKAKVDNHLNLVAQLGSNMPITFGTGGTFPGEIDSSFLQGGGVNVTQYANAIKATQAYINSQAGFTGSPIYAIEPFNEPDFGLTYANPTDLNSIITQLKTHPAFSSTLMMAPSVLNSDLAQGWYDQVPQATAGSSHLLAGSLTSYTNFINHVNNDNNPFINPEIHSMAEILAGAERGMEAGMVWADVLRGRGTLIQASDGDRLGYAENFNSQSAGAVYRAPDGNLYAFAGGVERDYMGTPDSYRFVSDTDVYFNGIKVREFMLPTNRDINTSSSDNDFQNYGSWSHEGAYADIDFDDSGVPALDGYRWRIVNVQDGSAMAVINPFQGDGAAIRSSSNNGATSKLWNITRTLNGYYHLYNAASGQTAEVAGLSLANGADVRQWGTADNAGQQWYVEEAGGGDFYIRNAHSNKYLDADLGSTNIFQWEGNGSAQQKWRFILDNPTHGPYTHYTMESSVNDSVGTNHATAFGGPSYSTGPLGNPNSAIELDGVNDYLQLPNNVISGDDLTIATWVRWDGGDAWQRIFDFGNGTDEYMFLTPKGGGDTMRFGITTDSNGGEQGLETAPLPVGEWVHLTLTLGGNTGILYVDGQPQVAGQILIDPTDFNPMNNFIGESQWANDPFFNGAIADFQIFNYALHPDQVSELVSNPDADGNGTVDGLDFLQLQRTNPALLPVWAEQYAGGNNGGGGRVSAVPEPTSLLLSLVTICGLASCRRSQPKSSFIV